MSQIVFVGIACTAAWASGHLVMRRGRHDRDPVEQALVAAVAGAPLLLSGGLLLAELGRFDAAALCLVELLALSGIWVAERRLRSWRDGARRAAEGHRRVVVSVLMLGLLAPLVGYYGTPVFDTRLEARDPGVYRLGALRLAREGSLVYQDPVVAGLSERGKDYFFPEVSALSPARSMGFYFLDRDRGLVVPQFMPGMMVWLAAGALATGNAGATAALLVLAYLVAATMLILGRDLLGWPLGCLAAIWLVMSTPQSWFVRYGTAEILAQLLLLGGCWMLMRHRQSGDALIGLLAGWTLGLLPVVKIELFLVIVPASILFLADCAVGRQGSRGWWSFWMGGLAALLVFFDQAWSSARPYVHDILLNPGLSLSTFTLATAAGVAGLALARLGADWIPDRWHDAARRFLDMKSPGGTYVRWGLALAVVALAVHGYWIRPLGTRWDSDNLVLVAWALSDIGLLLAVTGLAAWMLAREDSRAAAIPLLLLVPLTLLVLWRKQINPELLWAYRRYLPALLPLGCLTAAYALGRAWSWGTAVRRPPGTGRLVATGVVVAAASVTVAIAVRTEFYENWHELEGTAGIVRELGRELPPDSVVLFEPRTRRGLLRLEGAIEHAVGRPVLRLPRPEASASRVRDVLFSQARAGRRVYLMTTGYLQSPHWLRAAPVEGFFFEIRRLQERFEELPRSPEPITIIAKLYRVLGSGEIVPLDGELDVGGWDDLYLDGTRVYQTEGRPGERSFRWVSAEGGFWLPGLIESHRRVVLTLAAGVPSTLVDVRLDDRHLGRLEVTRGWRDYTVGIPGDWEPRGVPHLVLETEETFLAADVGSRGDSRELGVAVDRIRWSSAR